MLHVRMHVLFQVELECLKRKFIMMTGECFCVCAVLYYAVLCCSVPLSLSLLLLLSLSSVCCYLSPSFSTLQLPSSVIFWNFILLSLDHHVVDVAVQCCLMVMMMMILFVVFGFKLVCCVSLCLCFVVRSLMFVRFAFAQIVAIIY